MQSAQSCTMSRYFGAMPERLFCKARCQQRVSDPPVDPINSPLGAMYVSEHGYGPMLHQSCFRQVMLGGTAMPTDTTISRPSLTLMLGFRMSSSDSRKMSPTYMWLVGT